ncbi:MAG: hypothetical protein ACXVHO_03225 [Methanobacterium sp.]
MENQFQISIIEDTIKMSLLDQHIKVSRSLLPENFMTWQSKSRIKMFKTLIKDGSSAIRVQPSHLPVMATLGNGDFPINLATRGMGILPKSKFLEKYTKFFEEIKKESEEKSWSETLPIRAEAAQKFYSKPELFDNRILGGLEIFEGQTASNLQQNPLVSLIYTGEAPKFLSFQFNGVINFVDSDNEYYRFLRAARELFAFDSFHIPQINYPVGYLFYPAEILDKTPYPRR